jgi:hypothetical protein
LCAIFALQGCKNNYDCESHHCSEKDAEGRGTCSTHHGEL